MEFLVKGATLFNEPGVHIAFEETPTELAQNVASLGFDVEGLVRAEKLAFDHIHIDANEIAETGEFDLEGLFIRIGLAIDSVNAKRIVLDTIETLFAGLSNEAVLRSELIRLFRWLKDRGVTAIVTGERGEGQLTRQGMEEYVSDCVILLDHRVNDQLSTRRLRIVKYRGSTHGTNEYPFLIQEAGISVLPITSIGMLHGASNERIVRRRTARHHARRKRFLPRFVHYGFRASGYGQDHVRGALCGSGVSARREMHLLRV